VRTVLINSSALFDEEGKFVHTRCFTHDITERKSMDDAREQFMSILGHDLRNPLGAIAFAAASLLRADDLPSRHQRTVARIARGADRMSRMITDLLDFARGHLGQGIPVDRVRGELAATCRQIVEEFVTAKPDRDISLGVSGDTSGEWDLDRVAQVVSNLVSNALEHGLDPIRINLSGETDAVHLVVSNRGSPIPPSAVSTLFHPFSRVAGAHRTGLGLGLFIVNEIVRSHGGTVDVKSNEAEGTEFSVRWPKR
jgi:phosphoserine phosphatase RsbU/P